MLLFLKKFVFLLLFGRHLHSKQRKSFRLAKYCPGYVDWTPRHTVIFSKLLRTLDLSVRGGKVTVGGGADGCEQNGAEWIVWMLGGANDRLKLLLHFKTRACLQSYSITILKMFGICCINLSAGQYRPWHSRICHCRSRIRTWRGVAGPTRNVP